MIMLNIAGLRGATAPPPAAAEETHEVEFSPSGDPVLSPSQVSTWLMCPRKWAAKYLHGQHEPVAEGTVAGKRMHSLLEAYYKTGAVPSNATPEGVWALALIRETGLPLPIPGASFPVAERKFKFEYDGVWWRGSKDLTYARDGLYVIRDHKSTSELNPLWIKTGEKLLTDPQSVIYALEAYLTHDPEMVENEWGYVTRTKYPKTQLERAIMTKEIVQRGMEALTRAGHEMLRCYRERPALNDLPPTGTETGGCEAFRGCKVQGCNVSALDRIKGQQLFNARKQGGTDMGFIDELRARQATQAALAQGTPAQETAPAPATEQAAPVDIRSRLAAASAGAGASVAPPPFTPPTPAVAPAPTPAPSQAPAPTPSEAPRRGRGRAKAATPPTLPLAATIAPEIIKAMTESVTGTVAPTAQVETQELLQPTAPPSFSPGTVTQMQAAADRDQSFFRQQIAATDGYVLCINCAPIGDPSVILFSQYAEAVHKGLKEAKGWDHYGLYSFEGKATFQDALQQYLQQSPPMGYLVLWTNTDEGRDALPILERYAAGRPFRGF